MRLADLAQTEAVGAKLAAVLRAGDVITLEGPLGAGKTSIARGLLAALGLIGEAPSPSFAIVQPYAPPEVALPVVHVDLYVSNARLSSALLRRPRTSSPAAASIASTQTPTGPAAASGSATSPRNRKPRAWR